MYLPALNIYIRPEHRKKTPRLAGMLRGLLNSYDGFRAVAGLTNSNFSRLTPVRLRFSSVRKAHAFKRVVDDTLSRYVEVRKVRTRTLFE